MYMFLAIVAVASAAAPPISFKMEEINPNAGIVPAVALSDIDGDKDLDLVAMSNDDIAWYENPGWERHLIAPTIENLNVCMALADITGDGLPELAAGADWQFGNTKSGGSLHILVRGADVRQPWQLAQILSEPTIHRIRWADSDGDGRQELFVAPLKGRNTTEPDFREAGVRLMRLMPPPEVLKDTWPSDVVSDALHIVHNLIPLNYSGEANPILTASFEGLSLHRRGKDGRWEQHLLTPGSPQPWPLSGSSEIKCGHLAGNFNAMATVEPWHGNQLVVYTPDKPGRVEEGIQWKREVIDESLSQGHALGWADFDGDGRDELAAGYREASPANKKVGLNLYKFGEFRPGQALAVARQSIDDGGMATEDLAIGDVNGDGQPDIFAGGRATHNLRLYLNTTK